MKALDRPRQFLAVAIAALAGCVDAIGYFSAKGYFVSFMSGNTTQVATDTLRGSHSALTPLLLVVGFVAGVVLGRILVTRAGSWRKTLVLGLVTALLAAGGASQFAGWSTMALAFMVLAMGALNNTFYREEDPVGLTYMTGALVRIGQGVADWVSGRGPAPWGIYVALWCALGGGAMIGALAFVQMGHAALIGPIAASAVLCLSTIALPNR